VKEKERELCICAYIANAMLRHSQRTREHAEANAVHTLVCGERCSDGTKVLGRGRWDLEGWRGGMARDKFHGIRMQRECFNR